MRPVARFRHGSGGRLQTLLKHDLVDTNALVEVKSKKEALDLARQFMELHREHWPELEMECEVRPLEDA